MLVLQRYFINQVKAMSLRLNVYSLHRSICLARLLNVCSSLWEDGNGKLIKMESAVEKNALKHKKHPSRSLTVTRFERIAN